MTFPRGIAIGDDLYYVYSGLHQGFLKSLHDAFFTTSFYKYRPVLMVLFSFEIPLFGVHYVAYQVLDCVLETVNAVMVFLIVREIAHGRVLIATSSAVAFIICRFSFYNVLQVLGLFESLAILFMLTGLLFTVRSYQKVRIGWLRWTVLAFVAAIYTDERYFVLYPFILSCIALHPQMLKNRRPSVWLALAATGALGLNVFLKQYVFQAPVLLGTGGQTIKPNFIQMISFFEAGFANMFGFNVGPDYLSGEDFSETGGFGLALGIVFSLCAASLFGAYITRVISERNWFVAKGSMLGVLLFVPLLFSASVTYIQDFRWLYAPFAIMIIGIGAAGVGLRWKLAAAICVTAYGTSIVTALYYRTFLNNIYYTSSMSVAEDVMRAMDESPGVPTVIVDNSTESFPRWVFRDRMFFDLYGLRGPVRFTNTLAEAQPESREQIIDIRAGHATVLSHAQPALTDDGSAVRAALALLSSPRVVERLTDEFSTGKINSDRHVDTPTGKGALILDWPSVAGSVKSLTVLASFEFRYRFAVRKHESLRFVVARPYSIGTPTRAILTVRVKGRLTKVFDRQLLPGRSTVPDWMPVSINLGQFAGQVVELAFSAEQSGGDQTAAWAAFGLPVLVTN